MNVARMPRLIHKEENAARISGGRKMAQVADGIS